MPNLWSKLSAMFAYPIKRTFSKILYYCLLSLSFVSGSVLAQTTISPLTWTGQGTSASGPSAFTTLPASTIPNSSAIVVSQWNRGSGLSTASAGSTYSSSGFSADVSSTVAQSANRFLSFTVTNNTSTEISITQIFIASQISSTGPRFAGMLYKVGSGSISSFGTDVTTNHNASPENWTFTGTVNICPGNTTTFYLCGYGAGTVSTGTFRVNNNTSITASFVSSVASSASAVTPICAGDTLYITGGVSNGITPYSYSWSGPASFSSTVLSPRVPAASTSASGTYSVTATDGYGCSSVSTVTATVNPAPTPIIGSSSLCVGSTINLSDVTTGGSWSSSNSNAIIGSATGVLIGVSSGSSVITYMLPTGCITTKTITIDPLPTAITGSTDVCVGSTIVLSNATAGGIWSISNTNATIGSTTGSLTGNAPGSTTISYTLATGCVITLMETINPVPALISGPTSICVGDIVTMSDASVGGLWSSGNANISVGSSTGIVTGNAAGTSVLSYILPTGCFITQAETIAPLPALISGTSSVCEGSTIIYSDASVGGIWSTSNTNAVIGTATGILTGNVAGLSAVTYKLPTGCFVTQTLIVNPSPATIAGTTSICLGATAVLSDAITDGVWSSSNSNVSIGSLDGVITGNAVGSSIVSYVLPTGCFVTIAETVDPAPGAIVGSHNVCVGSSVTLSDAISGGVWSSSNTNVSIGSVSGIATGNVTGISVISYVLPTGCFATRTLVIDNIPAIITGAARVCLGSSVVLSDTTLGGYWSSSNSNITIGSNSGVVVGIATGTSVVSYILPSGCMTIQTETVDPIPVAITGLAQVCIGSSVVLSNSTSGGMWSASNTNATIGSLSGVVSGISAGSSTTTYMLSTGCLVTKTISVNPQPAGISGSSNICVGSSAVLSDITSGGTWSSNNSAVSIGSVSGIVTGIIAGTSILSYTLPTGCFSIKTMTVDPLPDPISGSSNVCVGALVGLSDASAGGVWNSSNTNISIGSASGVVTGLIVGTSIVSYMLGSGCLVTTVITVDAAPTPILGISNICIGSSVNLSDATPGGSWNCSNTNASVGSSTGIVVGSNSGISIITYILSSGCNVTASMTIEPVPSAISGSFTMCEGEGVTLSNATLGGTWSSSNGNVSIGSATGLATGIATGTSVITYFSTSGCFVTATETVNPVPLPISGAFNICVGATVILSDITPGGTWSSSNSNVSIGSLSGNVTGVSEGTSDITYMLSTGCIATSSIIVDSLPGPIVGAGNVCVGSSVLLSNAVSGGTWSSSNVNVTIGSTSGSATGISTGTSVISYISGVGCIVTATQTVDPLPLAISGGASVCVGSSVIQSDATPGGVWSLSNAVADIGSASGSVIGLSMGSTIVTYSLPTSCFITRSLTVDPLPGRYSVTGGGSFCAGDTGVHIGMTLSFPGTIYQLYNASAPTGSPIIGSGAPIDFGLFTAPGTYTILASNISGCSDTMSGVSTVSVIPTVVPAVSISSSTTDTVCAGTIVTFTALPLNGGTLPLFNWLINGVSTGSSGSVFSYTPSTGDVIKTILTSNATCAAPDTASSFVHMTVLASGTPTISISALPSANVCEGSIVTFAASPFLGGPSPSYRWTKNGINVGTGPSYSFMPGNSDVVYCMMHSTFDCRLADSAFSNHVTMSVDPKVMPVVHITAHPGTHIAIGQSDTLVATVTNGGMAPHYQWLKNGSVMTGSTSSTYISSILFNNDSISCVVDNTDPCGDVASAGVKITFGNVGINPVLVNNHFNIVPNPNTGIFTIAGTIEAGVRKEMHLMISDMLGQIVYNKLVYSNDGVINEQVMATDLPNGIYILTVNCDNTCDQFRIVISK